MKRKVDWFRVLVILALAAGVIWLSIILGRSPIGIALGAEQTYPLRVELPQPGYRKHDGSILKFTEFQRTQILYGTCDPTTQIGELYGEVSVKSWSFVSPVFRVPVNVEVCIVAVVIGLDGQPMGRSNVAKYLTAVAPGGPVPQTPQSLKIGGGS